MFVLTVWTMWKKYFLYLSPSLTLSSKIKLNAHYKLQKSCFKNNLIYTIKIMGINTVIFWSYKNSHIFT